MWSIHDLLRTVAERGDNPVLATVVGDHAENLGGAALADQVRRIAGGLRQAGVGAGDAVLLIGPNSVAWVTVRLAIALVDAVAVACDDQAGAAEVAAIGRDAGARVAFASLSHAAQVRDAVGRPVYLLQDEEVEGFASWRRLAAEPVLPHAEAPAAADPTMVVYTSGTTGAPKSFVLTHGNIAANVEALLATNVIGQHDRVLLPLPLHHVFPLLVGLMTTLASGARLVFPEAATGPQIAAAIKAGGVTVIVGVPRLYTALLAGIEARVAARGALAATAFRALLALSRRFDRIGWRIGRRLFAGLHRQIGPGLRLMVSGGAKLEPAAVARLEALGWEVLSGYGLAETASMFTGNLPWRKRRGSEGRPLGGGDMRIAEPDGEGIGEIQLRGPNVFAGYRDNPEANRTAFTADGWFRTGDLGRIDADGFLTVTGRLKEQLVLGGGKKVMPEELERHYAANPQIRELAVLERDGKLVAIVLPDPLALGAAGVTRPADAIRVALAERSQSLPPYQRIAGFALAREPLPRTRLGKFQRFRLPTLYDAILRGEDRPAPRALSAEDLALVETSPGRDVWDLFTARYADRGIHLDSNLALDLGVDSLEWMTVALELEARLGIRITEELIAGVTTVRQLIAALAAAARDGQAIGPQAAGSPDLDPWLRPTGPLLSALGLVLYGLNRFALALYFRLRAHGRENVPAAGPFVVIANHASDLDPPALAAALSWRRLRGVYWAGDMRRLFGSPLKNAFARAVHLFPVDERSPAATLTSAKVVLARRRGLIWFPESWRTPNGELQRFLPGIGIVLADDPVPVVPAYIAGTYEALPRTRRWPRPVRLSIRFGPAIAAERIRALAAEPDGAARIVEVLREAVAALESVAKRPISKA